MSVFPPKKRTFTYVYIYMYLFIYSFIYLFYIFNLFLYISIDSVFTTPKCCVQGLGSRVAFLNTRKMIRTDSDLQCCWPSATIARFAFSETPFIEFLGGLQQKSF